MLTRLCTSLLFTVLFALALPAVAQQQNNKQTLSTTGSIIARDVIAVAGDTLRTIARRELGKTGLSPMLAAFNGMPESEQLVAGQLIRIPLYVPLRQEFASVVFVKGSVQRNDQPLKRNDEIYLNDLLIAGDDGFLSLEFASGSVVNLQPGTHAQLVRLNCLPNDDSCLIEVSTDAGGLNADVQSREGQPSDFRITTPYASAAVRGTTFDFSARDGTAIVGVTDGNISVSAQSQRVELPQGMGSVTREGEAPGAPVPLLPPPVYRYVPTRAAAGDSVRWWRISDAQSYSAQLSTDSDGKSVVANFVNNSESVPINFKTAGDYYLAVRGIDANGLKGFSTTTRLTIATINAALATLSASVERSGREYLVSVIEPPEDAPGFEIQVAATADFADPLSVDVSRSGSAVFRLDFEKLYARVRILSDPLTVSAFGEITESR